MSEKTKKINYVEEVVRRDDERIIFHTLSTGLNPDGGDGEILFHHRQSDIKKKEEYHHG